MPSIPSAHVGGTRPPIPLIRTSIAIARAIARAIPGAAAVGRTFARAGAPVAAQAVPGKPLSATVRASVLAVFLTAAPVPAAAERLELEGIDGALADNVRAFLALDDESCKAPRWRVRRRFRDLDEPVREALAALGYYDVKIEKSLELGEACWTATVTIDPGEPVRLRDVTVEIRGEASADARFDALRSAPGLERGEVLKHERYERLKNRIAVLATERGYVQGRFVEQRLDVWPGERAADATLIYDSGPRYDFGAIDLRQDVVTEELAGRFVRIEPGDPYDGSELRKLYEDLSGTGYFASVEVVPATARAADGAIPVEISMTAADPVSYSVGAGASTDSGPRLRGGLSNQRVNRRGHQLFADLLLSPVTSEVSTSYRLPLERPQSEWLSFEAGVLHDDTETAESDTFTTALRRSKLTGGWLRTESIAILIEDFSVGAGNETTRLVMPSLAFSRTRSDRELNPTRGYSVSLELRGASATLGSSTSLAQAIGRVRFIYPFTDDLRLIGRSSAGTTFKDSFNEVPASLRFFAGGDGSVRGYGFETLGPEDGEGRVIGGSQLLTGSLELERRVWRQLFGAVFADAGNAFEGSDINARLGAGVGLKWRSPVGPIRFYLAHPVNFSDRSVRVHISFGPDL